MGSESKNSRSLVRSYVAGKVNALQNGLLSGTSSKSTAVLARLRRAAGKRPGESPDVWDVEFEGLPEALVGWGTEPSAGEWAVHLALTLYATHQQSQALPMHVATDYRAREFHGMGTVVRRMSEQGAGEQLERGEMPRRFSAMVRAESIEEASHYARQLVHQLRDVGMAIDYVTLAGQLYDFQNPYVRDSVRLEWAREFSRGSHGEGDAG